MAEPGTLSHTGSPDEFKRRKFLIWDTLNNKSAANATDLEFWLEDTNDWMVDAPAPLAGETYASGTSSVRLWEHPFTVVQDPPETVAVTLQVRETANPEHPLGHWHLVISLTDKGPLIPYAWEEGSAQGQPQDVSERTLSSGTYELKVRVI